MPDSINHPWDASCPFCRREVQHEQERKRLEDLARDDRGGVVSSVPLFDPRKSGLEKPDVKRYPR